MKRYAASSGNRRPNVQTMTKWSITSWSLLLLCLSVTACSNAPINSPPLHVEPPAIPPLATTARPPETPPECSPTCIEGLTRLRKSLADTPMPSDAP